MILAGALVIILGLTGYFLYAQSQKASQDPQSIKLEQQSDSDETDSIEKDLNETDFQNIDEESTSIETEIKSTY